MSWLSVLALGFVLGVKHAMDADHVAAVSAIVAKHKRLGTAWLLGAFWGLGHTATVFAVGALLIVFRLEIPARLGLGLEFGVGGMLVALGLMSITGRLGGGVLAHEHDHDAPHLHVPEEEGWLARHVRLAGKAQLLRAWAVGLVHGLAGSAAVTLLALAAIPDPVLGLIYLLIFGAGTLAGMLALSALMEWSLVGLARWWKTGERVVSVLAGVLSVAVGLWILRETGLEGGLFSSAPHWEPR